MSGHFCVGGLFTIMCWEVLFKIIFQQNGSNMYSIYAKTDALIVMKVIMNTEIAFDCLFFIIFFYPFHILER